MKVGLLSDTHGAIAKTHHAIRVLMQHQPDVLIHCGDLGSEEVVVELIAACAPGKIPVYAVLGNVDRYEAGVREFPSSEGFQLSYHLADVTLDGHRIAIIHGDDGRKLIELIDSGVYEYIFTGHTHEADDAWHYKTRVINPGAVYRANPPRVAILDLSTGKLESMLLK